MVDRAATVRAEAVSSLAWGKGVGRTRMTSAGPTSSMGGAVMGTTAALSMCRKEEQDLVESPGMWCREPLM